MKTYNTFAEAKLANPECDAIYKSTYSSAFAARSEEPKKENHGLGVEWVVANPAYHLMTLKEFLANGYKLVNGDKYHCDDDIICVGDDVSEFTINSDDDGDDDKRFILSAACFGGGSHPVDKPKTRIHYRPIDDSEFRDITAMFERRELRVMKGDDYEEVLGLDAIGRAYRERTLYRRIETVIDERQEWIDSALSAAGLESLPEAVRRMGRVYDAGLAKTE